MIYGVIVDIQYDIRNSILKILILFQNIHNYSNVFNWAQAFKQYICKVCSCSGSKVISKSICDILSQNFQTWKKNIVFQTFQYCFWSKFPAYNTFSKHFFRAFWQYIAQCTKLSISKNVHEIVWYMTLLLTFHMTSEIQY